MREFTVATGALAGLLALVLWSFSEYAPQPSPHLTAPSASASRYNSRAEMLRDADELVRESCELQTHPNIAPSLFARGVDCASLRRWRAGL